jgi:transposase
VPQCAGGWPPGRGGGAAGAGRRYRPVGGVPLGVKPLLPNANVSVDHWHLIKLANDAVTKGPPGVAQECKGRRGRAVHLAWAHRLLLLRADDRLSARGRAKLKLVLADDDPTNEIGAAWGIKEQLRQILTAPTVAEARQRRRQLEYYALVADMPETTKLVSTVTAWWPEIETLVRTRVTNAKTEAANLTIKTPSAPETMAAVDRTRVGDLREVVSPSEIS